MADKPLDTQPKIQLYRNYACTYEEEGYLNLDMEVV